VKLDRSKYLESRSLRPTKLFLAIVAVNLLLGLFVWLFPKDGITLSSTFKLKFISFDELVGDDKSGHREVNLDSILAGINPKLNAEIAGTVVHIANAQTDTVLNSDIETVREVLVGFKEVPNYRRIQIPVNNPNALKSLQNGLINESKTKVIRILHYGDSQLEGDRISDYFRSKLQKVYGGQGPGIVLPNEPAATSRQSVFVSHSKNMRKHAFYINGSTRTDGKYGIGGSSFTFDGNYSSFLKWTYDEAKNSIQPAFSSKKQEQSYLIFRNGSKSYLSVRQYARITLLYENDEVSQLQLTCDNSVNNYNLKPSDGLGVQQWDLKTDKELRLDFTNGKFPLIYGVALDGTSGVAVDNFPMRGSSAIGFNKMSQGLYRKQLEALNVRAIILQYGINVIPTVRSNYGYYRTLFTKQLQSIKAANPGVSILVIGPSDMSKNDGGTMVSYGNIPLLRDAMREAALSSGCCFWDLYEAMGGENSMVAWVNDGLAQKDYTHFSYKGSKYISEMLFDALMEKVNKQ
jgi:lysophospholipase L1-like esterase